MVAERILIVDDDHQVRRLLRDLLESAGYACAEAASGAEGLLIHAESPFALIMTDLRMSGMDGAELLARVKEADEAANETTAVVVVTGEPEVGTAVATLTQGAYDYISKPFDLHRIHNTVRNALERRRLIRENREYQRGLEELIDRRTEELLSTYRQTLAALGSALDTRDPETQQHTERVTRYTVTIARAMGIHGAAIRDMEWGAMVHDVGKIGIPDGILMKPGSLDEHDWTVMRRHPLIGYRLLKDIPFLRGALPVVRHHHEAWDGSGYPDGLKGTEIPLGARIFKVADVFDALTSMRPYRSPDPPEVARDVILAHSGSEFDPAVVEAFLRVYPTLAQAIQRTSNSHSHSRESVAALPR